MASLVLNGEVVATPKNYNERAFQVAVVNGMDEKPDTVVIGSSRGMFLGNIITGYSNIYNNCVSGASVEDYYALLGLYYKKFGSFPERVIIEVSPWIFYADNPESRWTENKDYRASCLEFYELVNGQELQNKNIKKENPYFSLAYFQYNISELKEKGYDGATGNDVHISVDKAEAADYPDGTIRYMQSLEEPNEERLKKVKSTNGGVIYENADKMQEIDLKKKSEFESIINYLLRQNVEVVIYMQPFSVTQCYYIYEKKTNPAFELVEDYLLELGEEKGLKVVGGYNAYFFQLSDEEFIDYMHLDKEGTRKVWNMFN